MQMGFWCGGSRTAPDLAFEFTSSFVWREGTTVLGSTLVSEGTMQMAGSARTCHQGRHSQRSEILTNLLSSGVPGALLHPLPGLSLYWLATTPPH